MLTGSFAGGDRREMWFDHCVAVWCDSVVFHPIELVRLAALFFGTLGRYCGVGWLLCRAPGVSHTTGFSVGQWAAKWVP